MGVENEAAADFAMDTADLWETSVVAVAVRRDLRRVTLARHVGRSDLNRSVPTSGT
jgi:hypothetical protein